MNPYCLVCSDPKFYNIKYYIFFPILSQYLRWDSANPSCLVTSDFTFYNIDYCIFLTMLSQNLNCDSANPRCLLSSECFLQYKLLHFHPILSQDLSCDFVNPICLFRSDRIFYNMNDIFPTPYCANAEAVILRIRLSAYLIFYL